MIIFQTWTRLFLYLVFLIAGIGALGVWIPIVQMALGSTTTKIEDVVSNLATLIISLAVTSYADFQMHSISNSGKTQRLCYLVLMLVVVVSGVCALTFQDTKLALRLAEIGAGFATLKWIFVNASNPAFKDDINPLAPLGGKI